MRSRHNLDRFDMAFDDERLDLGRAPGRAKAGDRLLTLVASDLAGRGARRRGRPPGRRDGG